MKPLKNWDNKTWLSSKKYISSFHRHLKLEINFKKDTKILDIGCGRANIISYLQRKYKFHKKPIGLDIIRNKQTKKNIIFIKKDAIKYLENSEDNFDLILIKQTIHFLKKREINRLLSLAKKKLTQKGKIIILFIKLNKNQFPYFKKMKKELDKSLKRDRSIIKIIKKKFLKYKKNNFIFKVSISKKTYIKMINGRFISCLLNFPKKEIKKGLNEIQSKYKKKIHFNDMLDCLIYQN